MLAWKPHFPWFMEVAVQNLAIVFCAKIAHVNQREGTKLPLTLYHLSGQDELHHPLE